MKRTGFALLILAATISGGAAGALTAQEGGGPSSAGALPGEASWKAIDVAIVLDTSGSMEPLIESARLKIWEIVQELLSAEPRPTLRAAVLTYGSQANGMASGWVRVESDFTDDLDRVSDTLLTVVQDQGGNEYVTRALRDAVHSLAWTPYDEALRLLFIAGNESADQDPEVDLVDAGSTLRGGDIAVHLIFCGSEDDEAAESWRELAELTGGEFSTIDLRARPTVIETPVESAIELLTMAWSF